MLPGEVKEQWRKWVNQVSVIGFSSVKYDINMVKEYFMKGPSCGKEDECNEDMFAVKKENDYMFLITLKFKLLDVKNYIGPALSYHAWCKPMDRRLKKLMFPYESLDSNEKLSHVEPVSYEDFYSSLKFTITRQYEQFLRKIIAPQCMIGCGYMTLHALCHLLRLLGRWLGNTILIKLMYVLRN